MVENWVDQWVELKVGKMVDKKVEN